MDEERCLAPVISDRRFDEDSSSDGVESEESGGEVHGYPGDPTTPLCSAVTGGNIKDVRDLLERGADVNAPKRDGSTPLLVACFFDKETMAKTLLKAGASATLEFARFVSPINYVLLKAQEGMLRCFLDAGAVHVNTAIRNGGTMLHDACGHGHLNIVKLLIERGADVNLEDTSGRTPVFDAITGGGHVDIIRCLANAGANTEETNATPICHCGRKGR